MNKKTKKILYWLPRIICIFFAMFLSLFALDVFSEGNGFLKTVIALLIHLIPVYIVVIVLIMSWRWGWLGAIMFNAFGILYIVFTWGKFPLVTYLVISGPVVLVGILFMFNWFYRKELRGT